MPHSRSRLGLLATLVLVHLTTAAASDLSFLDAVKAGDVDSVKQQLKSGQDVKARDYAESTALHYAAEAGNTQLLEVLLDARAPIGDVRRDGASALLLAAAGGHARAVELLLEKGADSKQNNRKGESAAQLAARSGNVAILELLAAHGADLASKDRDGGFPLMDAAANGREEAVTFLLSRKVRVNEFDAQGVTPLIVAAEHGSLRIVRELVQAGAALNAVTRDASGITALYVSLFSGEPKVAEYLLTAGASVSLKRQDGGTDFSVLKNACDLKQRLEFRGKFADLKCEGFLEAGSYAACDSGGEISAVLIPQANSGLLKPPALRFACPGSEGHSCALDSAVGSGAEVNEAGVRDWRGTLRLLGRESFVWSPESCSAGCGKPKVSFRRMVAAEVKLPQKSAKIPLLQRAQACPKRGRCGWQTEARLPSGTRIQALSGGAGAKGFVCVQYLLDPVSGSSSITQDPSELEDGESKVGYGWLPASAVRFTAVIPPVAGSARSR